MFDFLVQKCKAMCKAYRKIFQAPVQVNMRCSILLEGSLGVGIHALINGYGITVLRYVCVVGWWMS